MEGHARLRASDLAAPRAAAIALVGAWGVRRLARGDGFCDHDMKVGVP